MLIILGIALLLIGAAAGWFIASRLAKRQSCEKQVASSIKEPACIQQQSAKGNPSTLHSTLQDCPRTQILRPQISLEQTPVGPLAAEQREQQRIEAQEIRRAFTANVSHELKTPLTVISGYSELIKDGMIKPEDITEVSSVIHEEAGYMLNLVDDILTLSQLDEYTATSNTSAHTTQVDLAKVTGEVLARLEPYAKQNNVQCLLRASGENSVMGLERILTSIIYNLSENAIRYNKPGGTMEVIIEGLDDSVSLEVLDTGLGISEENQPRVFERFYRVDQAHSRHTGGTGLGLAIVKHGVQYHKATLSLTSKPEEGTRITVVFPRGDSVDA